MSEPSPSPDAAPADGLGLESFRQKPPEEGLSLDQLNRAFAAMLDSGDDPYSVPPEPDADPLRTAVAEPASDVSQAGSRAIGDDSCDVSPRSILEAMLFVGTPDNRPMTSQQIAGLMRGVRATEIDELVRDLNRDYRRMGCPYQIAGEAAGYRLMLCDEFAPLREKFFGRVRQARLSPAAIEVLAAVAYNEPLTADQINQLRGTASGPILAQLVRRQLLRIDRTESKPQAPRYFTTQRLLDIFGLKSLADLPRSLDLDRQ